MMQKIILLCTLLTLSVTTLGQSRGSGSWQLPERHSPGEKVLPLEWGTQAAGHLMRRAGFGASPEELNRLVGQGLEATLDELFNFETVDDSAMETGLSQRVSLYSTNDGVVSLVRQNQNNGRYMANIRGMEFWWLYRMIHSRRQLVEKMTFFWHDHFATSAREISFVLGAVGDQPLEGDEWPLMLVQNDTLRRNALGNFRQMVLEVARDPAMILWLNNNENRVGSPNENWARELLELFTMGESSESGAYTEVDIQEAARAFTGWMTLPPRLQGRGLGDAYQFIFNPQAHDFGPKTILGETLLSSDGLLGVRDGERVIELVFEQPQTARFIVRKLWESFVYPDPDPAVIEPLADLFRSADYEILPLMRALFEHPHFMSHKAYRGKIKSPVEYVVQAYRELGIRDPANLPRLTEFFGLGQNLFLPPDVGGWTHDEGWINTGTAIARENIMTFLTCNRGRGALPRGGAGQDPNPFAVFCFASSAEDQIDLEGILQANNLQFATDLVAYFTHALLQGDVSMDTRVVLEDYMKTGDDGLPAVFDIEDPVMVDKKVRGLIFLVTLLPAYQLN